MVQGIAGVRRVAVIGAGTIGASWAAYFLARGLAVTASDPAAEGDSFVRRYVAAAWPALTRLGLAPGASSDLLRFEPDPMAAVAGADFVQESGPEVLEVKRDLFRRLDAALPPEVIIASSSSGLLISRIQEGCRHPGRTIVAHPFNPPHLIPLVEIVGGAKTAPETIRRALAFYAAAGKHPIHIRKEVPGHLANRLQAAIWREAVHLVAEDVASVADVDAAIAHGPGLRWAIMGPHLTLHLAGGDGGIENFMAHLAGPVTSWWPDLGAPDLTPALKEKIVAGVHAEASGRSMADLVRRRDRVLLEILTALQKPPSGGDGA